MRKKSFDKMKCPITFDLHCTPKTLKNRKMPEGIL